MKANTLICFSVVCSFLLITMHQSFASHLRAGEITVERISCSSPTFRITITVYTNTKTSAKFGGDPDVSYIYFGDGSREYVETPVPAQVIRYDLDPEGNIATSSASFIHTYSSFRKYVISYQEPNRNEGVVNMRNSLGTLFYIETVINLDPYLEANGGCSSSPRLLVPPIDKACTGAAWTHNPGAYDPDKDTYKDSLSYEMVIPNSDKNVNVVDYKDPNDRRFYTNYDIGNEEKKGQPTFSINALDGTIKWDAPGAVGQYNIAFIVKEWRTIDGVTYLLGYVRRDMQIIVEDCDNKRPILEIPKELCVVAGTTVRIKIRGTDPDAHDEYVKIEGFSEIFNLAPAQSPAYMIYSPPDTLKPKYELKPTQNVYFQWETQCLHVSERPYQVVFKITDNPPPGKGAKLASFETMSIKVIGPPPVWNDAVLNQGTRSVQLKWEPYACQNAERIDIYRRVDSNAFIPDSCQTGLPASAGYKLIMTLPVKDVNNVATTDFLDTNNGSGLSPGAKYCYRLVGRFKSPGGESYVSTEICVGPFNVDAPVITNVSVEKTDKTNGQVFVRWTRPFDRDPGVYHYKVYRDIGTTGPISAATPIATLTDPDTTILDIGLNTVENIYRYRIDAYADGSSALTDSSKTASSVRVEPKSLLKKIELSWSAVVPWSNQINTIPNKHLIYRGPEESTENDLILIDSVDVNSDGFRYVDGNKSPLEENKVYSYRIMTRGGYGNPDIPQPLNNFSHIIRAQAGDETPPCQPQPPLAKDPMSCEAYLNQVGTCSNNYFANTITWTKADDPDCGNDIAYYNIYAASTTTGEFVLIKSGERTTTFEEKNLPSFARCYKISAVDYSENESELSNAVCFDNCPYYELPNVFTPNPDECNGRFSAYSNNERYRIDLNSEAPKYLCGGISEEDQKKCARFVERVLFKVYNRWGKEVYAYSGSNNDEIKTIYIDWDGRAADGTDLASGIYYYVADVTFKSVDPAQQQKTIKGWVHLVR